MPQKNDDLLREMIEKYARLYMKIAANKGIPYDEVEDIVMDSFLSFYKSDRYESFRDGKLEEAKLVMIRIVINKCNDYHRKHAHDLSFVYEEWLLKEEERDRRTAGNPEHKAIVSEDARRVMTCISEMREIWKELVWMFYIEERSVKEISERLEISEAVCRSRISRATKFLRQELKDIGEDS